jgi:hypothetical protein
MGAGKTAVLGEACDILSQRGIVHAAVDVDALGLSHLPSQAPSDGVMFDNLRAVCANYAAAGVQRFLLARAIQNPAQLKLCREALPFADTVVCRLVASIETMQQRVETRDPGILRQQYVARVPILNDILDQAQLEDFRVVNENRSLTDVSTEMLVKAGWISR